MPTDAPFSPSDSAPAFADQGVGVRTDDQYDGYFEHDRPELRALVPAHACRVLDVGCGSGTLGAWLKRERPDMVVVGLEGFPDAAATARERLDDAYCVNLDAIESLPEGAGEFDAIIFGDVLEHLLNPERLMRVLRDALAPGGVFVMSIPNVDHWTIVGPLLLHDRWPYEEAGLLDRSHVHLFTLGEVSDLMDRLALDVTHVGVNDHAPVPPGVEALVSCLTAAADDPVEAAARLGAYQYLVVATPGSGEVTSSVSHGVGPRLHDEGLAGVVPRDMHPVEVLADGRHGPVLDDDVRRHLAAHTPGSTPEAHVYNGVFAHIREPERVMGEIAAALRPDDVAVFSVGNVSSWDLLGPLACCDRWSYGVHDALRDHPIRFYTATEFRMVLEAAGMQVVAWEDHGAPVPVEFAMLRAAGAMYGADPDTLRAQLERRGMRVVARAARH